MGSIFILGAGAKTKIGGPINFSGSKKRREVFYFWGPKKLGSNFYI